eukprot:354469-Chlamydomonas_euryale.AAC.1
MHLTYWQPPLAEWIRRGQSAHTPPQRPPGAERKGRHKGRKSFLNRTIPVRDAGIEPTTSG